jgi:hypothetical protein
MRTNLWAVLCCLGPGASQALAQQAIWTNLTTSATPRFAMNFASAFDPLRNKLVTFGGREETPNGAASVQTQWELSNGTWSEITTGVRPSFRDKHDMVFDAGRGVIVLAGGLSSTGRRSDTWEYNGTFWVMRHNAAWQEDLDHYDLRLAYDHARGEVVRFGGAGGGGLKGSTYAWTGSSWVLRASGGPAPREQHAMAYDEQRQRVVLFGGTSGSGVLADTWEWNGSVWQQRFPATSPPGRREAGLAWTGGSRKLLLFGGYGQTLRLNDLWHWTGTTWVPLASTGTPPGMSYFELELDSSRDRLVLLRGQEFSTYYQGHWELDAPVTAPARCTPFGAGCSWGSGTPQLQAAPGSLPFVGQSFTVQLSQLPGSIYSPALLLGGLSNTHWNGQPLPRELTAFGMPGCQAWIAPEVTELLASAGGMASKTWTIPTAIAFVGLQFHIQGAVLALGTNPAGFVLSNAATVEVGQL